MMNLIYKKNFVNKRYNRMVVKKIETLEQFNEILKNKEDNKYIFADFYATWCGPCKRIAPDIEKFSEIYKNITFIKIDVDEVEDLANTYSVQSLPTFLVFQTGNVKPLYQPIVGADKTKIETTLKSLTSPKAVSKYDFNCFDLFNKAIFSFILYIEYIIFIKSNSLNIQNF